MTIQWKQKRFNNACVPACVAMLLSQYDIQKEDYDIIFESKRPYLIEFDISDFSFNAGVLVQSYDVMSIVPNKFGFELVQCEFENFSDFNNKASNLMNKNTPFITSLTQGCIPSPGYKQDKRTNGHAVVVRKIKCTS